MERRSREEEEEGEERHEGGGGSGVWRGVLGLGKKVAQSRGAVVSGPVVLPPLAVLSTIALPFCVLLASVACTHCLMRSLVPLPPMEEEECLIQDSRETVQQQEEEEEGGGGVDSKYVGIERSNVGSEYASAVDDQSPIMEDADKKVAVTGSRIGADFSRRDRRQAQGLKPKA